MSDNQSASRDALEEAIAENPAAVAAFVERLDAVNELLDVLSLGERALSDEMVRELSGTATTLAESADGLATDETVGLATAVGDNGAELQAALETIVTLQQSGALDDLVELAQVASLGSAALSDEMVRELASTGSALGEVADTAADTETRNGLQRLLEGVGTAESEDPERVGPLGLARGVRDPDVQYGMGYLLALAGAIGRSRTPDDA
jgi:uncharacterized protein YjgD (DUF1641 family)